MHDIIPQPAKHEDQLAERVGELLPDPHAPADTTLGAVAELNARRTAAAAAVADFHAATVGFQHGARQPDYASWALRLEQHLRYVLAALDSMDDEEDQADEPEDDHWRDYDYACSTCGALIGIFLGHGDGWHHYRGEGTVASPVELFDAGHEATLP